MAAPKFAHWSFVFLLVFSVFIIGACGGADSPEPTSVAGGAPLGIDEALEQTIQLYDQLLDVLAGVTDVASGRAAASDLSRLSGQIKELDTRIVSNSQEEFMSSIFWEPFVEVRRKFGNEFDRISANPAAFELVAEAFEDID